MKRLFPMWAMAFASFVIMVMIAPPLQAEVPSPDTIQAMAIYEATVDTHDDWPDNLVNYDVTDPILIAEMFSGIEADTLRDCSDLEADNNAYLYVKFDNGTRQVYHLFFRWSHFSAKGDRGNCFYVAAFSRYLFEQYAQQ